jgi:hypothetical protein
MEQDFSPERGECWTSELELNPAVLMAGGGGVLVGVSIGSSHHPVRHLRTPRQIPDQPFSPRFSMEFFKFSSNNKKLARFSFILIFSLYGASFYFFAQLKHQMCRAHAVSFE